MHRFTEHEKTLLIAMIRREQNLLRKKAGAKCHDPIIESALIPAGQNEIMDFNERLASIMTKLEHC